MFIGMLNHKNQNKKIKQEINTLIDDEEFSDDIEKNDSDIEHDLLLEKTINITTNINKKHGVKK
ncbi:MAG: hypothetical protein M0R46_09880 [Candidatus Muirbacterium halophilum]|nr:hypothetical protein [Candidatus Muirbacterium halophilum]